MDPKTAHFDIVSIGDASRDEFMSIHLASLECDAKEGHCRLCLRYAQKIPGDSFFSAVGGNACNNAVGSSRLGMKAALYTVIGDDEIGESIIRKLKKEKVSRRYVTVEKGGSNVSLVLDFKGDRTEIVYHRPRRYLLPAKLRTRWIYLTSLGADFRRLHAEISRIVVKNDVRLGFNPDSFQLMAGVRGLADVLKACEFLIVNREEAEQLLSSEKNGPPTTINELMAALQAFGPKTVVITDGAKGAYAYDGKEFYAQPIFPAERVESTGAGDAFATGFLGGLFHGRSVSGALRWGAANSASVIEHIGPEAGLLSQKKILERIRRSGPHGAKKRR